MKNNLLEKEKKLLQKAKKSREGFSELYTLFVNDVYRFSYSIVNDQHDAEDITSRVFMKLYEKIGDFEWRGISTKYWLFQTARNFAYETYRQPVHAEFNEDIKEFSGVDYPDISFVDEIMSKELLNIIQEELKILSPIEQETIALRLWEDMQFNEIAQVQNAKENTCKWRFYRAIKKLKEQLKAKNIAYSTTLPTICTALKSVGGSETYAAPGKLHSPPFDQLIHNQQKTIMKTPHKSLLTSNSGIAVITGTILVTGVVAGFTGYHLVATNNNNPVNNNQDTQQQSAGTMVTSTPENAESTQITTRTFQNEYYGVSFTYPETWKVSFGESPFKDQFTQFTCDGYWGSLHKNPADCTDPFAPQSIVLTSPGGAELHINLEQSTGQTCAGPDIEECIAATTMQVSIFGTDRTINLDGSFSNEFIPGESSPLQKAFFGLTPSTNELEPQEREELQQILESMKQI